MELLLAILATWFGLVFGLVACWCYIGYRFRRARDHREALATARLHHDALVAARHTGGPR